MRMRIQSSRGPLKRPLYRRIRVEVRKQLRLESPRQPQAHGFIATAGMAGRVPAILQAPL